MRIDIRFSSCNHHPTTQLSLTSHSPQVRVEYHVVYRIYLLCAIAPGLRPGSTVLHHDRAINQMLGHLQKLEGKGPRSTSIRSCRTWCKCGTLVLTHWSCPEGTASRRLVL